jgi:hypothetical protein
MAHVDPGDDVIGALPAHLQLGGLPFLPGRAIQPHSVAFLETSRVGQLVIACLYSVTGHFQLMAGEMLDVV